jgi:hypothetical protein
MNRHQVALCLSVLWWGVASPWASAVTAISAAQKNDPAITAASVKPAVDDNFKDLAGTDADKQKQARKELVDGGAGGGLTFALAYATDVNSAAVALLATNPNVRVRINVGVVVAGVAEGTKSTKLDGAVLALLGDKSEAVKLWGIKAARFILPSLANPAQQKLAERVVQEAKDKPTGPIVDEAYEALKTMAGPAAVGPLLDLLDSRIKQYEKIGTPEDPQYDWKPLEYLLQKNVAMNVWGTLTSAQQAQVMQAAVNLLSLAAQRGDDPAARNIRDQLQETVSNVSGALLQPFDAITDPVAKKKVMDAAIAASKNARAGSRPLSLYNPFVKDLVDAILVLPAYKDLKAPPSLPALQALVGP